MKDQFPQAQSVSEIRGSPIQAHRFSLRDSLVGLYFEVSAFLELVSIFVPAERRTGIPRRLALQVKLVPFDQGLASHQPELRSRSWTERERKETVRAASHQTCRGCGRARPGGTNEHLRARLDVRVRGRRPEVFGRQGWNQY